jgi:hypothetical protein
LLAELAHTGIAAVLPLPRATGRDISSHARDWLKQRSTQRRE